MKQHHEVKILPIYFDAINEGRKTYEVRKNDRGYTNADIITLKEWEMNGHFYTGREITFEIGFVLCLDRFLNNDDDIVVFSLIEIGVNDEV